MSQAEITPGEATARIAAEAAAPSRRASLVAFGVALALALVLYAPVLYYMVLHWQV